MRDQLLPTIYEDIQLTIEECYNDAPILEYESIARNNSYLPILIILLSVLIILSIVILIYNTTFGMYCLVITTIFGIILAIYEIISND